jgi:hypothetical protein
MTNQGMTFCWATDIPIVRREANQQVGRHSMKIIGAIATIALLAWGSSATAATCTAVSAGTNPDATLTHSVACGEGTSGQGMDNDTAALVQAAENVAGWNLAWTSIDKDEAAGSGGTGALLSTGTNPAGTSGTWGIDTNGLTYNAYLIVIKDGNSTDPAWFWFIIDTANSTCTAGQFGGAAEFCGTWTMYGENGTLKNISHLTLYGANTTTGSGSTGGSTGNVPTSGSTLTLLGLGLLGLGYSRRLKAAKKG